MEILVSGLLSGDRWHSVTRIDGYSNEDSFEHNDENKQKVTISIEIFDVLW